MLLLLQFDIAISRGLLSSNELLSVLSSLSQLAIGRRASELLVDERESGHASLLARSDCHNVAQDVAHYTKE